MIDTLTLNNELATCKGIKKKKKGDLLLAALGLRRCAQHSLAVAVGVTLPHGAWASSCGGFSYCRGQALGCGHQ